MSKRFCVRGHDTEAEGRDRQGSCRPCRRLYWFKFYAASGAAQRAKKKAQYAANPEKYRAIKHEWDVNNRDQIAAYNAGRKSAKYMWAINRKADRSIAAKEAEGWSF